MKNDKTEDCIRMTQAIIDFQKEMIKDFAERLNVKIDLDKMYDNNGNLNKKEMIRQFSGYPENIDGYIEGENGPELIIKT